jgi:hypothetical protein
VRERQAAYVRVPARLKWCSVCCLQNRALNLSLEKERQKVAKLQQALSQASQAQQTAKSQVRQSMPYTSWCLTCFMLMIEVLQSLFITAVVIRGCNFAKAGSLALYIAPSLHCAKAFVWMIAADLTQKSCWFI